MNESKMSYDLSKFTPEEILDLSNKRFKTLKSTDINNVSEPEKIKALILPKTCKSSEIKLHMRLSNVELLVWPRIDYIKSELFLGTKLKKIVFEKCGTIYHNAFSYSNIESFNFENVDAVCGGAFANSNIVSADFTNSKITIIPDSLFMGCKHLREIVGLDFIKSSTSDKNTIHVTRIGHNAFRGCNNLNIQELSFDRIEIEDNAFSFCDTIKSVEIKRSVLYSGVFKDCYNLESVDWGNSMARMPSQLFLSCEKLAKINNVDNVIIIGTEAFKGTAISSIKEFNNLKDIESAAFYGCLQLTEINSSTIERIGSNVFGNSNIENVTLSNPKGLILYDNAFDYAQNLKEVDMSKTVIEVIPSHCFAHTTKLKTIKFSPKTKKIEFGVFYGSGINEIIIPDSVRTIGDCAFAYCQKLKKVGWSSKCKIISRRVFLGCIKLKSITKTEHIQRIREYAFCDTNVTITLHVFHKISPSAFQDFEGTLDLSMAYDIDDSLLEKISRSCSKAHILFPYYIQSVYDSFN